MFKIFFEMSPPSGRVNLPLRECGATFWLQVADVLGRTMSATKVDKLTCVDCMD